MAEPWSVGNTDFDQERAMNVRALLLSTLLAAACHDNNPLYCEGHPTDPSCVMIDAPMPDGPGGCTSDMECAAPTAVCDTGNKMCVQCTAGEASACNGASPICGSDDMCGPCTSHDQCASKVCRPDGSCSDGSDVAYVDPAGTDNTTCSMAMPCTMVAKALATNKSFVKFTGTTSEQVTINNQNVTLLADPTAMLTESGAGVILTIMGSSQVSIYDLAITGALGAASVGISMPAGNTATTLLDQVTVSGGGGAGISATGGTLTIGQSTVSGNTGTGVSVSTSVLTLSRSTVAHNGGGGVSMTGATFDLTNNMIVNNGGNSSGLGGVDIESITTTGTHQLAFNTITANQGPNNVDTGVLCGSVVTVPIALDSDIVYGNLVGGSAVQFGGNANCTATYSDIGPDGTASGTNINADPGFVNATQGNYHLAAGSPCIDAADPAATLTIDIDGDTRPQGSGFDIGADEYKP
jgi:hypothetical protein